MRYGRTVALVVAVTALVAWVGTETAPAWLVVAAALAAIVFGTQARLRQNRLEKRFARKVWASFRSIGSQQR